MDTKTGNQAPAATRASMRASDADRDAVVADLSEHFQAGRLTEDELGDRTGRALTARTWAELRELMADLPAAGTARQALAGGSSGALAERPAPHMAPPVIAALAGIAIAIIVLAAAHSGLGLIWLLIPAVIIARKSIRSHCAAASYEHRD